jgi:hypothetical protein
MQPLVLLFCSLVQLDTSSQLGIVAGSVRLGPCKVQLDTYSQLGIGVVSARPGQCKVQLDTYSQLGLCKVQLDLAVVRLGSSHFSA